LQTTPLIHDAGALGGSANGLIGNPDALSSNLEALSFDPDGLSFDPEALSLNPDALSFDPETLSFDVGALIFDVLGRKSNSKMLISSNLRINPQTHLKKGLWAGNGCLKPLEAADVSPLIGEDGNQIGAHSALLAASKQLAAS
jgi:hypothetical protein